MNGYWNFHHNRSLSHDAAHGELGEANLGLVSAQPKSTRRTLAGSLSQVALELAGRPRTSRSSVPAVHRDTQRCGQPHPGPLRQLGRDLGQ